MGPRQSGKTTIVRQCFPGHAYRSLEDPDVRARAKDDPRGFLDEAKEGVILDEVQRVPELLSYVQGRIDEDRRSGRFILTGSHQPQVHQAISQSLAGRTAVLELYPFTLSEARAYEPEETRPWPWILRGFYPGIYEFGLEPARFYRSYMATYVERDIRQLIRLRELDAFEVFLRLMAGRVGHLVNFSALANDVGVSAPTIREWISVLKASYILFELRPWFANLRKRLVKASKFYFVDVGFAAWLLGLETPEQVERDPLRGGLFENLLILDAYKQLLHQGKSPLFSFFRDSNDNEVDLLMTRAGRHFLAVEIKSGATFQKDMLRGLDVFRGALDTDSQVDAELWYGGEDEVRFKGVTIRNPLKSSSKPFTLD
ncbi:MAG: ATP-binding protein [Kiritimatiellae bacterium]|nr:ATP-binding protein [Kiritimatiellia bacterium]